MSDTKRVAQSESVAAAAAELRAGDEEARIQAVRRVLEREQAGPGGAALGAAGLELLIEVMGDTSFRVRKEAARAAAAWPDRPLAAARLVDALAEPEDVGRRNAAIEAVVALGEAALEPLLGALPDRPEHRKVLVDAIGLLQLAAPAAGRAAPALCAALHDEDPNVRAAAAEALGGLRAPEVVPALQRALGEDRDLVVRLGALEGLNRQRVALPVPALTPLLDQLVLRPAALLGLGRSRDPAALQPLLAGLLDRARGAREAALRALCDLHDDLPALRGAIEAGLRGLSEPALRSMLRALLEATPEARAAAATLLRFSGQMDVVRPLVLALLDQHEAVARAAEQTLEAMGDPALDVLCDLLPDLDPGGRAALLDFFGRAGGALRERLGQKTLGRVRGLLLSALGDRQRHAAVAAAAARALGALGGSEALQPLSEAAAGDDGAAAAARAALRQLAERYPAEAAALPALRAAGRPEG